MRQQSSERGFILAALLFFIAVTAVLLGMLIPSHIMRMRRDKEAELIFRGSEYARAIRKFQHRNGALPLSTDELLMSSDGTPSLRKPYLDPTNGEQFRPIYVATNGTLANSRLYPTLRDAITNSAQTLAEKAQALADDAAANGDVNIVATTGGTASPQAGLVGVASQNDQTSVKIYIGQDRYTNWEFIANVPRRVNRGGTNPNGNATSNLNVGGAARGGND